MQRILVAEGQYSSLGMLMNKFSAQPEIIGAFFELNILRNSSQVRFTGTVGAAKNAAVIMHTFYPDDEITLEVTNANSNAPSHGAIFLSVYHAQWH